MDNEKLEQQIIECCAIAAHAVWNRNNNRIIADAEDIRQELWLWANNRREKIAAWLDPTQDPVDQRKGWNALRKSLTRQGDRFCRTQKARRAGYEPRDEAFYSEAMLDLLLPHVWTVIDDLGSHHDEGVKPPSNPNEGGNRIVSLFDVQVALSKLEAEDRQILVLRYREGYEPSELVHVMELSRTTVDRRLAKALRRLSNKLGGENPWR